MTAALQITIGRSRKNPRGRLVDLPDNVPAPRALASALDNLAAGVESWWSAHQWKDAHRSAAGWQSASAVCVDVDYHDADGKHVAAPQPTATALLQAAREGKVPGSVFHLTPRGCRLVFCFSQPVTDRDVLVRAARGAGSLTAAALRQAKLVGYVVDEKALLDLARLFFAPRAEVDGEKRTAEILILREEPYDPVTLAPPPARPRLAPALQFQDAARRYNQEHPGDWPRHTGTCPACGHKDCFGRLPDDPTRWACFSTSHEKPGIQGPGCYHGDALDMAAWRTGCSPAELLKREGYLAFTAGPAALQQELPGTVASLEQAKLKGLSKSYASLCAILRNDRRIVPEALEWNDMLCNPTVGGVPLEDEDVSALRERIELLVGDSKGRSLQFRTGDIEQAVKQVASEHRFHPVREYLEGLTWDGNPRIGSVAEDILGIPAADLTQTLLRKWFISAVARPLQPGCQVDHVLVLQGPQGSGKSTFFRALVGDEWFTDQHFDLSSDDGSRVVRRFWVIEWAELYTMHRARSSNLVKGFITRRVDTFRPPYGRHHVDAKRHCIIVGTTNDQEFLSDPTGNRRFWPIAVNKDRFDLSRLATWRDQLWAEAVHLYRAGEVWHLDEAQADSLGLAQAEFEERHPWEPLIAEWLPGWKADITTATVLEKAIKKHSGLWTRGDEMVVARCMAGLGYVQRRLRGENSERIRRWVCPDRPNLSQPENGEVGT